MKRCTKTGINISFKGMSYRDRFVMWWGFTKAILLQTNEAPDAKANSVDITISDRPPKRKGKK